MTPAHPTTSPLVTRNPQNHQDLAQTKVAWKSSLTARGRGLAAAAVKKKPRNSHLQNEERSGSFPHISCPNTILGTNLSMWMSSLSQENQYQEGTGLLRRMIQIRWLFLGLWLMNRLIIRYFRMRIISCSRFSPRILSLRKVIIVIISKFYIWLMINSRINHWDTNVSLC